MKKMEMDTYENDPELIQSMIDALQAQERLRIQLKQRKHLSDIGKVYTEACSTLDNLRDMKSKVEGTAITFEPVTVKEDVLQELRALVRMHVPRTLTCEVKMKMADLINKAFGGSCRKLVFAGLVTCPWYSATQSELGIQAKHNCVFAVYVNKDEQIFSPVNPHIKEKDSEVIDEGWFYASEVFHFANYLLKGKSRFIETLYLPESAVIYADNDWNALKQIVNPSQCLKLRGFIEQCRGQAVGSVGKKSKSTGCMTLKDGATLYEFCESFRLLHHAALAIAGKPLHLEVLQGEDLPEERGVTALKELTNAYKTENYEKIRLFIVLLAWKSELDKQLAGFSFTPVGQVEESLGKWLMHVRTRGMGIPKNSFESVQDSNLLSLMDRIGGPVTNMSPDNIVMIARAGSYLYGLDTPESDMDYLIVYADPIERVLSSCKRTSESVESRGPDKMFEYGAYEVRLFCEMLWKGSVVMLELLFAENLDYTSSAWKELISNKHLFLTERAILQYFGLIKNNMADIEHRRYIGTKREGKLFYQILHKLYCLEYFLKAECPRIKCEGPTRDFILSVRKGPLEGELHRDQLYSNCQQRINELGKALSERTNRLPENVNYRFLTRWLMNVRGWSLSEDTSPTADCS